ncbi:uncharacterized protein LOC124811288 [Hydra vulgaris]|uniref:uncharacterized protein LOC124811288 n=1 Tax=Hydra vulgaris TaxID=6087 RepID=UPI001F5E7E3E|nr:uncharacterized protein LOC124811288 [Hydra vulgaris]
MNDLIAIARTFDYHVVAVFETWFRNDSVPNIDGYNLYRKDRCDGRRGGGVAIYITDLFNSHEVNQFYTNSLEQVWVSVQNNPKLVYKYINNQLKIKDKIRSLKNASGEITETLPDILELLNSQFKSMFTLESPENFPLLNKSEVTPKCNYNNNLDFSIADIINELTNLNPYKSFGPDGLHPLILKICAKSFAIPLTKIFYESFNSGIVPTLWKLANISPIYKKKGDKLLPENYRPISLTSVA